MLSFCRDYGTKQELRNINITYRQTVRWQLLPLPPTEDQISWTYVTCWVKSYKYPQTNLGLRAPSWSNADYTSPDLTFVFTPQPATPGQYNSSYSFHPSVRRLRPAGCRAAGLQYKTPAAGGAADSWLWWGPTSRPQLHREMRKCKVKLCCFLYPSKQWTVDFSRGFACYNPFLTKAY